MLIVRVWEGLGNQMFQYAFARALKARGENVKLDLNKAYDDSFLKTRGSAPRENAIQNFNITVDSIDVEKYGKYRYLRRKTSLDNILFALGKQAHLCYNFYEAKEAGYSKEAMGLRGNYYIKGWFQSEQYFSDIRSILIKEFTPRKKIALTANLREVLGKEETVSLHIRRGDYLRLGNGLPLEYYIQAVEEIRRFYANPIFLVFSDDMNWVMRNLKLEGQVVYVNEDRKYADYEELLIMSRCKSNIIANSTFSWWAAWLNRNDDKHVIAPKKWFGTQTGIIPDAWITI